MSFFVMQDSVHGPCPDLQLLHFHLFTIFETLPLRPPFYAMQAGVHGRGNDLRLCHFYLFAKSLKLSL
jgi:hypothetical protein